jgi:tetratricopeptide (TPR) repeat protein
MLQDLIKINPQSRRNYHTGRFELATPVVKPKEKAKYYFQWALMFHARNKPAEAYKYYEKAILHNKNPLYLKQMAILHHEMGYLRDALKYIRTALDIEKKEQIARKEEKQKQIRKAQNSTAGRDAFNYAATHSLSKTTIFRNNKNFSNTFLNFIYIGSN